MKGFSPRSFWKIPLMFIVFGRQPMCKNGPAVWKGVSSAIFLG
jgi:hypothetical protein